MIGPHFTARSEWLHLPCNVGKKFFRTIPWRNTIDECTVSSLTQKSDETWKIRLTSGIFRTTFEITTNDIGKTVFLTREEAEKALEGIKDE
nr:MAG TPA: EbsA-like protein [Caudoviricetes sp.]